MSRSRTLSACLLAAALLCFPPRPAQAHETFIKVNNPRPRAGVPLDAALYHSHVVIDASEQVTDPADATAEIIQGQTIFPVALRPDPARRLSTLEAKYPALNGPAWLAVRGVAVPWSRTTRGLLRGDKQSLPAERVLSTDSNQRFVKVLLNSDPADQTFAQPLGHGLEIVPLANPATLRAGDDLPVRILADGVPVVEPVLASYDGFTDRENSFAFYIEPEDPDDIHIRLTHPGLWVLLVRHTAEGRDGIREQRRAAVLEFMVQP